MAATLMCRSNELKADHTFIITFIIMSNVWTHTHNKQQQGRSAPGTESGHVFSTVRHILSLFNALYESLFTHFMS